MLQLRHFSFELPFQYPFTISKGLKTHQPSLIVSLGLGQLTGFGEAPAISYYNVNVPDMVAALEAKRNLIERYALTDPQRFWHFLEHLLPGQNFLIGALDAAGWDLFARLRRMPLYRLLGLNWRQPLTDYTLGLDTADAMVAKMQAHPWPIYKIKIAKTDDLDLIRTLRAHTEAPFRIDANEALNLEDSLRLLPELQALGVSLVEQPLPRSQDEQMQELKAKSPLPLFADESCATEQDVDRCAAGFHGINIKLAKCGGITPALRMIPAARKLGLKVMMGSMNESSVGTAAVVHLLPLLDEVDADGPMLLAQDLARGLEYEQGLIRFPAEPGLGIRFTGPYDSAHGW
jgi:L-alanine-DL-glutamate epimerase-like enolase superfamily enzyme